MRTVPSVAVYLFSAVAIAQSSLPADTTYGIREVRIYRSQNGSSVRISSIGNLVGIEYPTGISILQAVLSSPAM